MANKTSSQFRARRRSSLNCLLSMARSLPANSSGSRLNDFDVAVHAIDVAGSTRRQTVAHRLIRTVSESVLLARKVTLTATVHQKIGETRACGVELDHTFPCCELHFRSQLCPP